MTPDIARRAIQAAYEQGWRHACDDHIRQRKNPEHPIGASRRVEVDLLLLELDPHNLLGLKES